MAEEDEIDVLGDFSLDNLLTKTDSSIYENTPLVSQNSDLLNCDYTIHPQWLLDKPSANPDCWYDNSVAIELQKTNSEPEAPIEANSISDESGWTENEKSLLERAIEIFGKSNVRLSQFIGSRTASEVKYYLKNFYNDVQTSYNNFNSGLIDELSLVSDVLDETQIPASIEEVIAAVSTAKPTVKARKKTNSQSSAELVNFKDIPSGHSVLKSNNQHRIVEKKAKVKPKSGKKSVKFKIKTELKFPMTNSTLKQKTVKIMNRENKKTEIGKVEITTGRGLAVPICEGEEIVKIIKEDSLSDVEIDVDDNEVKDEIREVPLVGLEEARPTVEEEAKVEVRNEKKICKAVKNCIDLSILSEELVKELTRMDQPEKEVVLEESSISELEKVIHCEFFEGRPTKTPLRYLKIRNHIINAWMANRPNYVKKTTIRQGLKNCGDVNCISRIHSYLEQIGAINFGCEQTVYVRPLHEHLQTITPTKHQTSDVKMATNVESGSRPRVKRKFANDGEGGCTLQHDEKGDVINTTIVNEEPAKPKTYVKKPSIRLIYCRPFPPQSPQRYKVKLTLTTLLLMDFHAHTSLAEVMGLVGGTFSSTRRVLTISHYEPTRNAASSATHCDMCPVAQSRAADLIHNRRLDVLGWFHSHPTFAPEPSQQDLDTQRALQRWIGARARPCVGLILSPFSALIASPFRCMMVDQFVPYRFQVEIITNVDQIEEFLEELQKVFRLSLALGHVEFGGGYFLDESITFLEKYITSVRMHLAKCGNLSKSICDYIINSIGSICSK